MQAPTESLTEAQVSTSMKDPDQLKRWLAATGRDFLVLNALDLVDALRWPEGVVALQELLNAYQKHREATPTGKTEITKVQGKPTVVPVYQTEDLSRAELLNVMERVHGKLAQLDAAEKAKAEQQS